MIAPNYKLAEQIRILKAQGLNQSQIARELGYTQSNISNVAKTHDITDWPRGAAARDQTGDKNPFYIDGLSRSTISRTTKKVLIEAGRDLTKCERCGYIDFTNIELPRHHKDRDRSNNNPNNLEVICWSCHNVEHMPEQVRDELGRFNAKK